MKIILQNLLLIGVSFFCITLFGCSSNGESRKKILDNENQSIISSNENKPYDVVELNYSQVKKLPSFASKEGLEKIKWETLFIPNKDRLDWFVCEIMETESNEVFNTDVCKDNMIIVFARYGVSIDNYSYSNFYFKGLKLYITTHIDEAANKDIKDYWLDFVLVPKDSFDYEEFVHSSGLEYYWASSEEITL